MREFSSSVSALVAAVLYQQSEPQEGDNIADQSREDAETPNVENEEDKRRLIWANW